MRFLITGINGFLGPWLVQRLFEDHGPDAEVWGMAWGPGGRYGLDEIEVLEADLTVPGSLPPVIEAARPEIVFHLAAASSVVGSWADPARIMRINALGQIHLLEAIRQSGLAPLVVVASSAQVYGLVTGEGPAHEDLPLVPRSPYGVSKASQELIAMQYHSSGLPAIRLRLFNLTGPGRPSDFVDSSFARQIAEIEQGLRQPPIRVGNLDASRDFTDVRDAARAFSLVAAQGRPGEVYNLCSGTAVVVRAVLDQLLASAEQPIASEVDPQRLRPADIPHLWGDPGRLTAATGWHPQIPLRQTLQDLLDWWRASCARGQEVSPLGVHGRKA